MGELPTAASLYLPEFIPYFDHGSSGLSANKWVQIQAKKPLSGKELSRGYIYVYWNRASFGVWKIGCTGRDVELRLSEWADNCKHSAAELYRSVGVRNVRRVERLIHADLKDYRVFQPACHSCLTSHNEWFTNVDFEVILERIEFWCQWISKEPYTEDSGLLKEDARKQLPRLLSIGESSLRKKERLMARTSSLGRAAKRLTGKGFSRTKSLLRS